MNIRFFDFSKYHGKYPPTGSTHIRVHQLIKYWEEANVYEFGEAPDVLIFQKVYCTPDYKFPAHYPKLKILDMCDPDWFNGLTSIKETVDAVDAVTCSSEALSKFVRQLTNKPVVTIRDRFDLTKIPAPKQHKNKAKTVVWFGYRHNSETLRPALSKIDQLGLKLIIVSDDDPMVWQWIAKNRLENFRENSYEYIRYDEKTVYEDIQKADFAILPKGDRPEDIFKSNNKTVKSILAGLPVAKNIDDITEFIEPANRQEYIDKHYQDIREEYTVLKSVEQYKELIQELQKKR